jgi:hypothetical protein
MRRFLFILSAATVLFACNQTRNTGIDKSGYDVVTEKSYVVRQIKPLAGDSLQDVVIKKQQELISYLEQNHFTRHIAGKDSLLFRRANGLEVLIELPVPQDAWESHTIIAFDPQKNPLFVNLHKDTTQIANYIKK